MKRYTDKTPGSFEQKKIEVFEDSPNGMCISTLNHGRYVDVNDRYADALGYTREELIGRTSFDINLWADPAERDAMVKALVQTGRVKDFEFHFRDKKGHIHLALTTASLFTIGGESYILTQTQDITERKQIEKKLLSTLESFHKAIATTINVLVTVLESRDPYTAGHQYRSAKLACAIAKEMGLPEDKIEGIRMAGIIHDIGKLSIPAEILTKPSKLSGIELRMIREHSRNGYEMLKNLESPWPLSEIVFQHHERIDGTGYPRKLKGDEILLEARILAVADVVEAMASYRPYRESLGIEAALAEIEKNKGVLYDTLIVEACLRLFREKHYQLAV